jgi:hypothetical protein
MMDTSALGFALGAGLVQAWLARQVDALGVWPLLGVIGARTRADADGIVTC